MSDHLCNRTFSWSGLTYDSKTFSLFQKKLTSSTAVKDFFPWYKILFLNDVLPVYILPLLLSIPCFSLYKLLSSLPLFRRGYRIHKLFCIRIPGGSSSTCPGISVFHLCRSSAPEPYLPFSNYSDVMRDNNHMAVWYSSDAEAAFPQQPCFCTITSRALVGSSVKQERWMLQHGNTDSHAGSYHGQFKRITLQNTPAILRARSFHHFLLRSSHSLRLIFSCSAYFRKSITNCTDRAKRSTGIPENHGDLRSRSVRSSFRHIHYIPSHVPDITFRNHAFISQKSH